MAIRLAFVVPISEELLLDAALPNFYAWLRRALYDELLRDLFGETWRRGRETERLELGFNPYWDPPEEECECHDD